MKIHVETLFASIHIWYPVQARQARKGRACKNIFSNDHLQPTFDLTRCRKSKNVNLSITRSWKHLAIIEFGFCRIWRILQIKEGVIHRGRRLRWITPSKIYRILNILQKPNSIIIIALLFIQNIFPFLKEFCHFALCFSSNQNNKTLSPDFLVNGSIICSKLHFWSHFDIIGSIIFSTLHFWHHWFNIWSTAAGCGGLCVQF